MILDVSKTQIIKGAEHFSEEINQLYHPTAHYPQDSIDTVYAVNSINQTRFTPILLKEWFYLVKTGGHLVIDYKPNKIRDFQKLEETMWWLWKGKYEIIYHGPQYKREIPLLNEKRITTHINNCEIYFKKNLNSKTKLPPAITTKRNVEADQYLRFICKKTSPTVIPGDSINSWSFGIVTNGQRLDWLEEIFTSIRNQKIPNYEIIICGSYPEKIGEDMEYIPFNHRDKLGWITRKKNEIVKTAKYENMCVLHDRVVLDDGWFEGMKKWGNCFEHLGCVQYYNGQRAGDWVFVDHLRGEITPQYNLKSMFLSSLDYRDYDINSIQGGMLHIAKRKCLKEVMWNETFFWADGKPEDIDLAFRLRDAGYLTRFNPYSKTTTKAFRFGAIPERKFTPLGNRPYRNPFSLRIALRSFIRFASLLKIDTLLVKYAFNKNLYFKFVNFKDD